MDLINPTFFHKFWDLIGETFSQDRMQWISQTSFLPNLNNTIITLIPKCGNPNFMKDLRPISFCNVLYKIVAKVLANRLKLVLPKLISDTQSAFVKGQSITDNVITAFELIYYMKRKVKGKVGDIVLKVDISKAYDHIDWVVFLSVLCLKWVSIVDGLSLLCFV